MKDEKTQIRQEKIIELASSFCDEKLDEEYKELSIKLVEKLGRKHDVPFKRGKIDIWASAVIYALGQINFLFDESFEPYSTPDEICDYFNTKKSTVSNKAHDIREMLNMGHYDEEFSTQQLLENQPSFYIDEKTGMIIPEDYINPMDSYFDEVYDLYAEGKIDEAIYMLDAIDEDNPEYERAMFYKSFILNANGIEDNSSEIFQEFLSDLDDDVDLKDLLEDDDDFDENNPQDLFEMGVYNYDIGDYENAIEYFDLSLKILPKQTEVLEYKALALFGLEKNKKALKIIDKAIKLDSNNNELYKTKGLILSQSNKIKEAIKCFDKSLALNPNDELSWIFKGNAFFKQENYEKALECYDKAIELDPEDISYYIHKANVYVGMNDYENAEKILDEAEKIDDEDADLLFEKGNFLLSQEKLNEAKSCYDKCLEIDDEFLEALLFKAVVCAKLNQEKEMEKCLNKIMEVNPLLLLELDNLLEN